MIAMAIACEPKLLIADEPTTALDVTIQKQILDLIARAAEEAPACRCCSSRTTSRVVGEIADHVVVMRNGEIREQGTGEAGVRGAADAYTKALLQCRPRLDRRPVRLPVIDDFMGGGGGRDEPGRAPRGVSPADPIILDGASNLGKSFYAREGLFGKREFKAVKDVSFDAAARARRSGLVGESGSGKTTVGLTLHAPARGDRAARCCSRAGHPVDVADREFMRVQAAHPDHLPEPVRVAQSALHRRPDPDRADADPRHRRGDAGAHRARVRAARARSGCPRSRSTSIRTSSRAASASASRSRAA